MGGARPRSSLLDSRPERIPPRAPALERWAGTRMRSAGSAVNVSRRRSRATPAMLLTRPASTSTGRDVRTMRRSWGSDETIPATRAPTAASPSTHPSPDETRPKPRRPVASQRAGRVRTSPRVETSGAFTLSRSHPKRTAPAARPRVAASTGSEATNPPPTDTRVRSARPMVSPSPSPTDTSAPMRTSTTDMPSVSAPAASTFWPRTVERRSRSCSSPAWMAVDTRLPNEPNTLPRSPMAAGTRRSRPGRRSKVPVSEPSTAPATKLVDEFSASATRPCRASAPGRKRRAEAMGAARRGRRRSSPARRARYRPRSVGLIPGSAPDATMGPRRTPSDRRTPQRAATRPR